MRVLGGYSNKYKAIRVFNTRTRKVEENLHIKFLENKSNVAGSGPEWLFDIDSLTKSMNYEPVTAGNQTNGDAGIETNVNAGQAGQEKASDHEYILLPLMPSNSPLSSSTQSSDDKDTDEVPGKGDDDVNKVSGIDDQERTDSSTQDVNTVGPKTGIFNGVYDDEDVGAEANLNNLETTMNVSPIPTTRVHKDHPKEKIIEDLNLATQTRRMINFSKENVMVWTLVDLPKGKRAIGTKWVYRNKKDERGIVVRNKARLVAQGYTQEEGIDYDEVFGPVARIEAIRLFLAYASFVGFIVYQMDVKSAFLYGTIEEEVYVCQPLGFEDPQFPDKVYKVEKALYGLHQAPKAWYETLSTYLLENRFRRGTIDKTLFIKKDKGNILLVQVYVDDIIFGSTKKSLCDEFEQMMHKRFQMSSIGELTFFLRLQVKQKDDGIFIIQDKYVADILKKFDFSTVKTTSTPKEPNKALIKDEEAKDVDVLSYTKDFISSCCEENLYYLKGQHKLGLWYPRDSSFDLEAFFDSDFAGASLDRKSTTGAEYVATANCCGQVQRIENKAKTLCSSTAVRGTVAIRGCWIEASERLTCHHMIGGSSCY
ncbi:putative ribonuclease H-like domain-containing protein [Tanacetum coccineum]